MSPGAADLTTETVQAHQVHRDSLVIEVPLHHAVQPRADNGDRLVPPHQLRSDRSYHNPRTEKIEAFVPLSRFGSTPTLAADGLRTALRGRRSRFVGAVGELLNPSFVLLFATQPGPDAGARVRFSIGTQFPANTIRREDQERTMKKTTLVSLFLLLAATPTFGQETTGYVKCGIGGKEVYLLDSPTNSTAVARLKCGDRVALLNEQNGNFTVRTQDGKQGYVSPYFLSAATPATPPPVSAQQPSGVGTKASPQT